MKKVFLALLSVLTLGVLAACGTSVEEISLDESSVELEIGETVTVTATVEPEDAEQAVEWSTDDDSVATVEDGEITAVAGGSATITATSTDDEEITADVDVTVIPDPDSISLSPDTLELEVGETGTIDASISPDDAVQEVTWSSDDEDIATVDDGEVTAVAAGQTTITVTAERDDGVTETADITVIIASESVETVLEAEMDDEVHTTGVVTGFAHNGYYLEDSSDAIFIYDSEYYDDVEVGDRVQLLGTRAVYEGLHQISDLTSLEVLESDVDLPDTVDMTDVDLTDDDAVSPYQSHRIDLEGYLVETITVDDEYGNYELDMFSPFDEYSLLLRWDSRLDIPDDDGLFDLEENDLLDITGMHLGWYDGPQLAYNGDHAITESDRSLDLAIELENVEDGSVDMNVSEELQLDWEVQPQAYVDNQDLDFESSDDSVVTVDTDGLLTAVGTGDATITLTSDEDPDVSVDVAVSVENLEVTLNDELNDDDQLRLRTTETFELDYTVGPDFASQDVTVESDDTAIVDVTDDGDLEAVAEGTANITITSDADPEASETVEVLVEDSEPVLDFFKEYDIYQDDPDFEPLQDATASDYIDGDLTDDIEITDDGGFDVSTLGEYTIEISVTNSFGETDTGTITVNVLEEGETLNATGTYNFKYADSDTRHTLFAAAERYLLETVYGGVPSTVNAGYALYSSRMQLPVEDPVPVMNYGVLYGNMATDDSAVEMDDGDFGETDEYTYRTAETSDPGQFNQWLYDDSISSDMITLFMDSLYYFNFNDDKTGYDVLPSMADGMPNPIEGEENDFGVMLSDEWHIDLKDDLEWFLHEDIDTSDFSSDHEEINADDFIDTYKLALEENWFRAVSGGGDFTSAPQKIVNAQAFADGEADWEDVGLKKIDDHTIGFEFEEDMSEWTTIYWLSSFVTTPIHMDLYDELGDSYGTSEETVAAHGPFYLSYYEADKALRFKENPNFHDPDRINFTGYNVSVIPDDETRFQEFLGGKLDTVGVPPAQYESFQNDPRIKPIPGDTTFRASINSLGTVENQKDQFEGSEFEPEPLLAWESDSGDSTFRNALYHAWNRETIAEEVQVTSQPMMYYFSEAYLVAPEEGVSFREWDNLEANKDIWEESGSSDDFETWLEDNRDPDASLVGEGLGVDTYGYNPDLATAIFEDAMDDLVADGEYELGTADDPLEIELQFTIQSGSSAQTAYAEFMKSELEDILKYEEDGDVLAYVTLDIDPVEFPDNYYTRILVGATDIGMGGIAGSTLDAASFLDVFCDDNRGGFTMDWGIDTSKAEIEVTYVNATGNEVTELWSYNALVRALNETAEVENGVEVED